jgi:hypothetical protein
VDLPPLLRKLLGHSLRIRCNSIEQVELERIDGLVIELLLTRLMKDVPRQSGSFPCMIQANVSKIQSNSALGLGERGDEEIRSEGDGCGDGRLAEHGSMFAIGDDTMNVGAIGDEGLLSMALNS